MKEDQDAAPGLEVPGTKHKRQVTMASKASKSDLGEDRSDFARDQTDEELEGTQKVETLAGTKPSTFGKQFSFQDGMAAALSKTRKEPNLQNTSTLRVPEAVTMMRQRTMA